LTATGEIVPWAEVGLGVRGGTSGAIVVGVRVSPVGRYGAARDSYEGGSFGVTLRALAGIGLSVGEGALTGGEFWTTATFTLGAEAGASITYSRGASVSGLVEGGAQFAADMVQVAGLAAGMVAGGVAVIGAIPLAIGGMFAEAFAIFDVNRWYLSGYTGDEQVNLRAFGRALGTLIRSNGLDAFLDAEHRRVSIAQQLGFEAAPLLNLVVDAINARDARSARAFNHPVPKPFELIEFTRLTFLEFLNRAVENGWLEILPAAPPASTAPSTNPAAASNW